MGEVTGQKGEKSKQMAKVEVTIRRGDKVWVKKANKGRKRGNRKRKGKREKRKEKGSKKKKNNTKKEERRALKKIGLKKAPSQLVLAQVKCIWLAVDLALEDCGKNIL